MNGQPAKFICVIALIDQRKKEFVFRGTLKGKTVFPPRGENGFGYDSIFIPLNFKKTLAEISPELKNSLSHRKKALIKFSNLKKSKLEKAEMIEAIRFIENGMKIKILEVKNDYIGIDTIEDLTKARKMFND